MICDLLEGELDTAELYRLMRRAARAAAMPYVARGLPVCASDANINAMGRRLLARVSFITRLLGHCRQQPPA